jgi:hypothetical protein
MSLQESSSDSTPAVSGRNTGSGSGVSGESQAHHAIVGVSRRANGVVGHSHGEPAAGHAGVFGEHLANGTGVVGKSDGGFGVVGVSRTSRGVFGESQTENGVVGHTHGDPESTNAGVFGEHTRGGFGGFFIGHVGVTQDLRVNGNVAVMGDVQLIGGDIAEQFGVARGDEVEPGCVVVLAGDDRIRVSDEPYDRRVAGVVSGAGSCRPGLVLDRQAGADRLPLALTGKVWCKVDADCSPVALGDLLTTSATPGHAMLADDPARAFGAVIGKALRGLQSGRALIPVLVALQ